MSTPSKPAAFDPEMPPPGVEKNLISFWQERPTITPRLQLVHTNWASTEGSIESSKNWAEARNDHTIPHFQVDRSGRAAMLLPLNRKGIANYKAATFSTGIETADRGLNLDPSPAGSPFSDAQAESVALCLAYTAWGYNIPLEYPTAWDGTGSACHTEPFGFDVWTNSSSKRCPGDIKKQQMRDVVLPRARAILAAWTDPQEDDVTSEELAVALAPIQSGLDKVSASVTRLETTQGKRHQALMKGFSNLGDRLDGIQDRLADLPGWRKWASGFRKLAETVDVDPPPPA